VHKPSNTPPNSSHSLTALDMALDNAVACALWPLAYESTHCPRPKAARSLGRFRSYLKSTESTGPPAEYISEARRPEGGVHIATSTTAEVGALPPKPAHRPNNSPQMAEA